MNSMRGSDEERLDALLRAYARACPGPEPSANFMPNLWQRIESRQSFTFSFHRMANAFVTGALALSIGLGVYMSILNSTPNPSQTYIEALAEANPLDTPDLVAPVSTDAAETAR